MIYIAPLFLYFPGLVPGVETQPLLAIIVAVYALFTGRNRKAPVTFAILASLLLFWVVVRLCYVESQGSSTGLFMILIGPIVLFGAMAQQAPPPSRRVVAIIAAYYGIAGVLEIALPDFYGALASSVLDRASVIDGHRGISLFTPEPTYAALSAVYFLMLSWWSGVRWGFRHRWVEPLLAGCLIATGSTYVVLFMFALAYAFRPRFMVLLTAVGAAVVPLLGFVTLDNDESIRAVVAVSRVVTSDFNDFLPSLSIIDSSLGSRLATNVASFLTPIYQPLGFGLDCAAVGSALSAAGFEFAFYNPVIRTVIDGGCLKPQSYLATVMVGLGGLSIGYLLLLFVLCRHAQGELEHRYWRPPAVVAGVILVVQGQITNPIPWLLIFFAMNFYTLTDPQSPRPSNSDPARANP